MLTIDNPKTFNWSEMPLADCAEGNAMDSYFTLKLFKVLEAALDDLKAHALYEKLISPITTVFAEMERRGLDVSRDSLDKVGRDLRYDCIDLEDDIYESFNLHKKDNIYSNNDLISILYTREGGYELYPPDLTKGGKPSVSAPTLKILLEQLDQALSRRKDV